MQALAKVNRDFSSVTGLVGDHCEKNSCVLVKAMKGCHAVSRTRHSSIKLVSRDEMANNALLIVMLVDVLVVILLTILL